MFKRLQTFAVAAALGAAALSVSAGLSLMPSAGGKTVVSVTDYGAKCDNFTDDTLALNLAGADGRDLYLPVGQTCVFSSQVVFNNPSVYSIGGNGILRAKTDLGAGVAGIVFNGTYVDHISLMGPFCTAFPCPRTVGVAPAQMDGIEDYSNPALASQPFFNHVHAEGFHAGIAINTNYGHWRVENSVITNNLFGIYVYTGAGDAKVFYSEIVGNSMAGIGCASSGHCLDGNTVIFGSHIGFSPFGIYQEAGTNPNAGWIDGLIEETHFEQIGNGGIVSHAQPNGQGGLESLTIIHPGWSWDCSNGSNGVKVGGNGGLGSCAPGAAGTQYTLTAQATATGNPSVAGCNITGLTGVTGTIRPGMKVIDNTNGTAAISYWTSHVYNVTPTSVSLTVCPVGTFTGDSLTFEWDSQYAIDTPACQGNITVDQGDGPITPGTIGLIHSATGICSSTWRYTNEVYGPPGTTGTILSWSGGSLVTVDNINNSYQLQDVSRVVLDTGQALAGYSSRAFSATVANAGTTATVTVPWTAFKLSCTDGFGGVTLFPTATQFSGTPVQGATVTAAPADCVGNNITFHVTLPAACTAGGGCAYTLNPYYP